MLGYPFGWMIAAGLFFLLLLVIACSPVVIRGHIKRVGDNDDAELRIRALLGIVNYHWKLPEMKMKGIGMELKRELTAENIGGSESKVNKSKVNANEHPAIDRMVPCAAAANGRFARLGPPYVRPYPRDGVEMDERVGRAMRCGQRC